MLAEGRDYIRRSLAQFDSYLSSPILELGSGTGNVTLELLRQGFEVTATDVSAQRLERLRARAVREVSRGRLTTRVLDLERLAESATSGAPSSSETASPEAPRTVIAFNVIEHVARDSACVRAIHDLLAPGGAFLMLVPAHQALFSELDVQLGHHRRYEVAQARRLLQDAGFQVPFARSFNLVGALGWFLNFTLLRRTQMPQGQFRLFERLNPLLALEDKLPVPFGLSIVAVGVKAR